MNLVIQFVSQCSIPMLPTLKFHFIFLQKFKIKTVSILKLLKKPLQHDWFLEAPSLNADAFHCIVLALDACLHVSQLNYRLPLRESLYSVPPSKIHFYSSVFQSSSFFPVNISLFLFFRDMSQAHYKMEMRKDIMLKGIEFHSGYHQGHIPCQDLCKMPVSRAHIYCDETSPNLQRQRRRCLMCSVTFASHSPFKAYKPSALFLDPRG